MIFEVYCPVAIFTNNTVRTVKLSVSKVRIKTIILTSRKAVEYDIHCYQRLCRKYIEKKDRHIMYIKKTI